MGGDHNMCCSGNQPDIVERLRQFNGKWPYAEAADEITRLREALRYEENRFSRIGTHGPDCHTWGPGHYECALQEIERLREQLFNAEQQVIKAEKSRDCALREYRKKVLLEAADLVEDYGFQAEAMLRSMAEGE